MYNTSNSTPSYISTSPLDEHEHEHEHETEYDTLASQYALSSTQTHQSHITATSTASSALSSSSSFHYASTPSTTTTHDQYITNTSQHASINSNQSHHHHSQDQPQYKSLWLYFFILGTINNFAYVVVLAAADSLAKSFGQAKLLGLIQYANVGMGVFSKAINTTETLERISHAKRLAFATILLLAGLIIISLSVYVSFYFAILGITFIGIFSAFGESILLGFLKLYPPSVTGAWSSGTGMAGVGGTLFYLLCRAAFQHFGLDNRGVNEFAFLLLIPQAFIYWMCFRRASRFARPDGSRIPEAEQNLLQADHDEQITVPTIVETVSSDPLASPSLFHGTAPNVYTTPVHPANNNTTVTTSSGSFSYRKSTSHSRRISAEGIFMSLSENNTYTASGWTTYWRCLQLVLSPSIQLLAVYFFEYVASVGFASKANPGSDTSDSWWEKNSYEILAFCYQFGVLISRSSISILRVERLEILTFLQGCNFALWFYHAMHFILPLWAQFLHMTFVGLLGGAMYVNTFFNIMVDKNISDQDREKCLNITSLFVNLGIVLSSIFEIVAAMTFLK